MRPAPDAHFDQLIKIDLHFLAAGIVLLSGLARRGRQPPNGGANRPPPARGQPACDPLKLPAGNLTGTPPSGASFSHAAVISHAAVNGIEPRNLCACWTLPKVCSHWKATSTVASWRAAAGDPESKAHSRVTTC